MATNWADVSPELLELCSHYLRPQDLRAFRAVCRSRRSVPLGERSSIPWLMLADKAETTQREVFCLSCRLVHQVPVPEEKAKRCLASRGWLFALGGREVCMMKNPMSRHNCIIKLPHDKFDPKFVPSVSPTTSLDCEVMAIHSKRGRRLWFWKPGDEEWTAVNIFDPGIIFGKILQMVHEFSFNVQFHS